LIRPILVAVSFDFGPVHLVDSSNDKTNPISLNLFGSVLAVDSNGEFYIGLFPFKLHQNDPDLTGNKYAFGSILFRKCFNLQRTFFANTNIWPASMPIPVHSTADFFAFALFHSRFTLCPAFPFPISLHLDNCIRGWPAGPFNIGTKTRENTGNGTKSKGYF
jgi:hypothetical protein